MPRLAATLAAAVALVLLAAAPAGAWQIERAEQIAAKVWHDPCAGRVDLHVGPEPDLDDHAYAEAYVGECRIVLAPSWPRWGWPMICATIIHEYGHIAGFRDPANVTDPEHSLNPRSIMYPFVSGDARCDQRGRPYLGLGQRVGHRRDAGE